MRAGFFCEKIKVKRRKSAKNGNVGRKCGKSKGKKPIKNEKIPKMFTFLYNNMLTLF